jgi:hypothetical protein
MAEKLLKLSVETQEIEQGASIDEVDQQVDVAILALLTTGYRAEQSDASPLVPGGHRLDVVAVPLDQGTKRCPAHSWMTVGSRHG